MRKDLTILNVKSIYDKEVYETVSNSKYETDIQAGAALTFERIAELTDDTGDSISGMNRRYSELTAMYWAWKNLDCEYIGLCHYRRKFGLTDEDIGRLLKEDIDIAILEPIELEKSIEEMYMTHHYIYDWIYVLELVRKKDPKFYNFIHHGKHHKLHPACMAIYRKELFHKTCEFLFPVLEEFCKSRPEKRDIYQRRDAGFLGERLLSLYFEYQKNRLCYREVPMRSIASEDFLNANGKSQIPTDSVNLYACDYIHNSNWTKCSHFLSDIEAENHQVETLKKLSSVYFAERENEKETFFDYLPHESGVEQLVAFYDDAASNIVSYTFGKVSKKAVNRWMERVKITPTAIKEVAKLEMGGLH